MEAQKKQEERELIWETGNHTPEVMTALLDLARISQHVESTTSNNSEAMAILLLERLMVLCQAQHGALLFRTQRPREAYHTVTFPPYSKVTLRTLALQSMNEEEADALVTSCSEDAAIQSPPQKPCWLLCRLPITVTQWEDQVSRDLPADNGEGLEASDASSHIFLPMYALLVLGWDGNNEQVCLVATKKAHVVLPLVADAAGSALTSILLAERVYELETLADHQALDEMELLKAELLATVSHELRSPLASVKGYAATLLRHERRISREERHEFLLAIKEASDRLEAIIDRLLEISQLETGGISIQHSPVDLVYLIREAITSIEQRLDVVEQKERFSDSQRHATFTLSLQDERGMPTRDEPLIQADRHRLREVLDNLFENALKYSPEGGAIEVIVRPLDAASQASRASKVHSRSAHDKKMGLRLSMPRTQPMIEICVQDHGMGIPDAHLERIFDRFHRVDTRLTREVGGIGLGLAICKRIVELHGGMIWVESEIGTGSTFHIWLPIDGRFTSL